MQVALASWRRSFALTLLAALVAPVLAACGGTPAGGGATSVPQPTAASQATSPAEATAPAAATAATAPTAATQPTAATGGDTNKFLVYGNSGEPNSLDSMDTDSGQALVVTAQIEEPLLDRTADPTKVGPLLAEKWTPNADSTEWTFTLRKGIKFHDGTDLNADAVVFNFKRMADPKFEFGYRDQGKTYPAFNSIFGGFADNPDTLWKDIEKVDDSTVKFITRKPFPLLPNVLSASYFGISSPDAVKKAGAKYGTPDSGAVGTGAFKFESWKAGENIILVRNDDYWGGQKAKMAGAVVRFISDAPARLAELQAGSIDFTVNLPADARETITGDANLQVVPLEPFNVAYVAMNLNNKPFDNPKVRQAIALALNKKEILDGFYSSVGSVASDFLPDAMAWARPEGADPYEYNPEKAKQLLAEAGYPNGFSTMVLTDGKEVPLEFWYMPVSRPYFSTPKPIAEAFAAQLAEVGIKVELKTEDWGAYLDNVDAGKKNGMWMLGWTGDYSDPNNFLYVFFGPSAKVAQGYENKQLIDLLQQAAAAPSQDASAKLFKQAGELIRQDVPRVPIVHAPPVLAAKKALQGWKPSPFGSEPWIPISIEK